MVATERTVVARVRDDFGIHDGGFERQDALLELRTAVAAASRLLAERVVFKGDRRSTGGDVDNVANFRRQLYRHGLAETTGADRTRVRPS